MKIRSGSSSYGDVILTMLGNRVIKGSMPYGENMVTSSDIVYTILGNQVIKGSSSYGDVIATTEGGVMSGAAAAAYLLL